VAIGCAGWLHNLDVPSRMTYPRIYADFNGHDWSLRHPGRHAVALDTIGSLQALSNAGLRLRDGVRLIVYDYSDDEEDLEAEATVRFRCCRGSLGRRT
jgi:hypothetical protein